MQSTGGATGLARENLRKTGSQMEEMAAAYLTERGIHVLERNFRSRDAEIDIIGRKDGTLLFIEVKARAEGEKSGTASEAVGTNKQKRICRCADYYMHCKGIDPYSTSIRFDVVAITMRTDQERRADEENAPGTGGETALDEKRVSEIRWIQNAFDYVPYKAVRLHWRVW